MSRPFASLALLGSLLTLACGAPGGGGHDHGPGGHDHGGDHGHGGGHDDHEEEGVSLAITRWTETHELFVELDAPVAGAPFAYHAHVTRMADNHAATEGTLTIRFDRDGSAAESHTDPAVARPGIFAAEGKAPAEPGVYQLVFSYVHGDERAVWSAGAVTVGAGAPEAGEAEAEGEITFLKEAQWQVPFHVGPAAMRPIAPVVRASGVVRPSPAASAVVAAPAEGLWVWSDVLPVVGRQVQRGDRLGLLLPAAAAEHGATLQGELQTARIDRELAEADLRRVEALTGDALVSGRRVDEARAALARAEAHLKAAERRLSALSSGEAGAIAVRAPASGTLVAVGAGNGEVVRAGEALVTVVSGEGALIDARVHARTTDALSPLYSLTALDAQGRALDLQALGATVLTERLVFDPDSLSAPLAILVPPGSGLRFGDLVELELGVGLAPAAVTVPRSAVVEINSQDVVFVQKTGESFTRRRVTLDARDATHVVVLAGVEAGEMVVQEGGFDVHVASLSGALESHRH